MRVVNGIEERVVASAPTEGKAKDEIDRLRGLHNSHPFSYRVVRAGDLPRRMRLRIPNQWYVVSGRIFGSTDY